MYPAPCHSLTLMTANHRREQGRPALSGRWALVFVLCLLRARRAVWRRQGLGQGWDSSQGSQCWHHASALGPLGLPPGLPAPADVDRAAVGLPGPLFVGMAEVDGPSLTSSAPTWTLNMGLHALGLAGWWGPTCRGHWKRTPVHRERQTGDEVKDSVCRRPAPGPEVSGGSPR